MRLSNVGDWRQPSKMGGTKGVAYNYRNDLKLRGGIE